ncbi:tRNA (5-methylaminomethyl-2-thiouridine)(34)-methyltransferase MnmD [Mucilaginibacter achroorhodeus]|uniref:tRNA (5-methylaminomethyl-2-thiouridine)(34)-methyltransferase MnmD n=1 Tax=Mucilaginibacter achroorhodeus TaxID=2599294 RepID=A0A563U8X8_9SPHI|nr:tRNA (5-methylaminomethyl-2-thiouridine)(34)-methyltransferase MnmD [Mucilaginibacter achroorhodeus]TWR27729.1 tRNA (5-methylaminomethyl-2-thiouridine)(34)-methyltransferase MnmD [Mucilaginibacter achroorhodeus]
MNKENTHLTIVTTADGSKTIHNAIVGENYHSKHGALQESQHVFLKSGLQHFLDKNPSGEVSVLEVGFGTGLNFLLTADYCSEQNIKLRYTGIEAYPLTPDMIAETGYENFVAPATWENFISDYPAALAAPSQLLENIELEIAVTQLTNFSSGKTFDVIYFDAFAAIHQPEMWTDEAIAHTFKFLKPGGVFVTYAITGNLKRSVKALGLKVEKAPGAPGKREMLRAVASVQ